MSEMDQIVDCEVIDKSVAQSTAPVIDITAGKSCAFNGCTRPLNHGISLNNIEDQFTELQPQESMHLECYFQHCIDRFVENRFNPQA